MDRLELHYDDDKVENGENSYWKDFLVDVEERKEDNGVHCKYCHAHNGPPTSAYPIQQYLPIVVDEDNQASLPAGWIERVHHSWAYYGL